MINCCKLSHEAFRFPSQAIFVDYSIPRLDVDQILDKFVFVNKSESYHGLIETRTQMVPSLTFPSVEFFDC